jgi:hypothetical protein
VTAGVERKREDQLTIDVKLLKRKKKGERERKKSEKVAKREMRKSESE